MNTLFISDLHLDSTRPHITAAFEAFIRHEASQAQALYILGDLFEAWVGDDDPSEAGIAVANALQALHKSGVPVYFMHGNRDFLVGQGYARRCSMRILPDPAVVLLQGKPILLSHGDLLCTGEAAYQAFRTQTRDPSWQRQFLSQPLAARLAFAQQARTASQQHQKELRDDGKMDVVTDVAVEAVTAMMAQYGIDTLIHGHTHRPAIHRLPSDAQERRRIVLGDWYTQGSVLRIDETGYALISLPT